MDKPRGFAVLGQDEAAAFLAPKPVGFIYGVGHVSAAKLANDGYRIIADLQRADEIELMKQFSSEGRRLWRLARGIDDRRVVADRGAKTISSETTFETDVGDFATLEKMLWRLSEKVSARPVSAQPDSSRQPPDGGRTTPGAGVCGCRLIGAAPAVGPRFARWCPGGWRPAAIRGRARRPPRRCPR